MHRSNLLSSTLLLLMLVSTPAAAQHALGDGGPYDPSIPTPASVLGYELGERFTPHHMIVRYAEALAEASGRVRLDTVALSYEGREVLEVTITSEANQARLEAIREQNERLADPRGLSSGELDRLVASTPTVVWLGYTIHGNEASGVEAALGTMYELAASGSAEVRAVLDSAVTLIDPVQNPDGHERHVQDVMRDLGVFGPDPHPAAMVHGSPWPGARTSHYLFDLNRDWFIHSHPETRGRMSTFHSWHPHVAVDLHEMGSNSTYFFSPPMEPINKNVDPSIIRWWDIFARGNADALAAHGWGFFTREGYDEFWPGYGISWPVLTGAVGMTYEQASSRGGAIRRNDGSVLTLREAAAHHYTTSLATLSTAAARRAARVRDFAAFRRSAVTEAERAPLRTVFLRRDADGRADALVDLLRSNDIAVGELGASTTVRATSYRAGPNAAPGRVQLPAGTYVVDIAQPQGRLAKAILEPDAVLDSAFIREELASRAAGESDRFYDVTAWSLPLTYRVDAWWSGDAVRGAEPARVFAPAPTLPDRARYAYVIAPGDRALRLVGRLLADSVRVRYAPEPFRVGQSDFPRGAYVVLVNRNPGPFQVRGAPGDLHELVTWRLGATGGSVVAVNNALVDAGADLGSNSVEAIPTPRVALVGGSGISSYSFGAAWYAFDQQLGFPVTRVELGDLARTLEDFNVVVLPSAFGISGQLGSGGTEALRDWVRGGGTLVTLDAATAWLAGQEGLTRLRLRDDPRPGDADTTAASGPPGAPLPTNVPGAIVRAIADTLSPLLAGIDDRELAVQLSGSQVYRAPDDVRPGEVVLRLADQDRLRLAGYLWPEVPERVAGMPWLWTEDVGAGRIIAFTGDPNFRTLFRGLLPLFANAVFLGPAM